MPKKNRAKWSQENLRRALQSITNGTSISEASKQYEIPRTTLGLHYRQNNPIKRLGRKSTLSLEQELHLVARIHKLAEIGVPVTSKVVRKSVFSYAKTLNISTRFSEESQTAGIKWLRLFFKRYPDVVRRKAQQMNPARAQKINPVVVNDYFTKLKNVMIKLKLFDKPENLYNMDEKGCRLTIHKQQTVLAKKGVKRVYLTAPEHGENVTIVGCGNALGQAIPPFILFKGKRLKPEWSDNLPPGSKVTMTPKGSMTNESFIMWLEHFAKYKNPGTNTLLIFDGAKSHLDVSIVDAAEKYGVTLFCLPSNTTHELQPMDKSVFKSFETFWDQEILNFLLTNPGKAITKMRFGDIFRTVWLKSMTPANITSGFRATGIFPFNPDVIPESAFAPSLITYIEENKENGNSVNAPSTSTTQKSPNNKDELNNKLPTSVLGKFQSPNIQPSTSGVTDSKSTKSQRKKKLLKLKNQKQIEHFSSDDSLDSEYSVHDDSCEDELSSASSYEDSLKESLIEKPPVTASTPSIPHFLETPKNQSEAIQSIPNTPELPNNQSQTTSSLPDIPEDLENQRQDNSFKKVGLLITPEVKTIASKRKPAINSKAQEVTRNLFLSYSAPPSKKMKFNETKGITPVSSKARGTSKKCPPPNAKSSSESWYCFLCKENRIADMRLCVVCKVYVHEECVGLSKQDKELFKCPNCA